MFYPPELLSWTQQVSSHFPHLSRSQAQVLAWYSFAVTLVQSSGLSQVSYLLAHLLGRSEASVRQRLRELLYDAADKRGQQRREVEVARCFLPLFRWVWSLCASPDQVLFLALDATTLRQTFTVLTVSVLVGRCAIPIAWVVLPATQPGKWQPHWQKLLLSLGFPIPETRVLVLADRGLYAKWLFETIVACGWHPLLRVNAQGNCCIHASGQRLSLAQVAGLCAGHWWHGEVTCFSGQRQLCCTLLVLCDAQQQAAWLLLTDLPPTQVSPTWYGLRMWIESGFKALKRGAFHWQRTRMTDPARAERLWLVLALAGLRVASLAAPAPPTKGTRYPRLSLFKRGMLRQLAALIRAQPLSPFPLRLPDLPPAPCLEFLHLLNTYP